MSEGFEQLHILPIEPVAVAGLAGVVDEAFRVFGLVAPVDGMDVIALDLVGGGGASPDEIPGEGDVGVVVDVQHDVALWQGGQNSLVSGSRLMVWRLMSMLPPVRYGAYWSDGEM